MMALPENVPVVTVDLDQPRRMALTLGAMRRLKEQTGLAIMDLGEFPADKLMESLGKLIWSCLINEDRVGLTVDDVEELIHPGNLGAAAEALGHLMASLNQKGAEGNAPAAAKTQAARPKKLTSNRSGLSASTTSASPTPISGV